MHFTRVRRPNAARRILLQLAVVGFALTLGAATMPSAAARSTLCLGCHGAASIPFRNPETGAVRDLHIDLARYRASAHAPVDCQDCHTRGFDIFPHDFAGAKTLGCMDCHPRDDPRERAAYPFERIDREFRKTVHFTKHPRTFRCHHCHDPHTLRPAAALPEPLAVARRDNDMCLACHAATTHPGPLADPAKPDIQGVHPWLPHAGLHWRSTRCVDCHAPHTAPLSHVLLTDDAVRDCALCHTGDSILLSGLYRREGADGREVGFLNATILRDAYVVGATPNLVLDRVAAGLVGAVLLLMAAHVAWRVSRRRRPGRDRERSRER